MCELVLLGHLRNIMLRRHSEPPLYVMVVTLISCEHPQLEHRIRRASLSRALHQREGFVPIAGVPCAQRALVFLGHHSTRPCQHRKLDVKVFALRSDPCRCKGKRAYVLGSNNRQVNQRPWSDPVVTQKGQWHVDFVSDFEVRRYKTSALECLPSLGRHIHPVIIKRGYLRLAELRLADNRISPCHTQYVESGRENPLAFAGSFC